VGAAEVLQIENAWVAVKFTPVMFALEIVTVLMAGVSIYPDFEAVILYVPFDTLKE